MRFLKDSPSIPDDLLFARDEGRVVFFCGAGVSRARAGLPDFFGLADDVISNRLWREENSAMSAAGRGVLSEEVLELMSGTGVVIAPNATY